MMMAASGLGSTIRIFSRNICRISLKTLTYKQSLKYLSIPLLAFIRKSGPVFVPSFAVVQAWGWGNQEEISEKSKMADAIIKEADELFDQNKYKETYDLLVQHKNEDNIEILWRLSRVAYLYAKEKDNAEEKKKLDYESFQYAEKCLAVDDSHFAGHKWYGILLDVVGGHEGTKQRIQNSFKVKEHFTKAIELNPTDATTIHSLGYWHFLFADMPWYQRKIAAVVFSSPPTATYQEALDYFKKAEETSPNFYSKNYLMLGKTYKALGDNENAILYLKKARDYEQKTVDDKEANKEAVDLLKALKVKD